MILIISSLNDESTNDVIFWLKYLKKDFVRLNEDDIIVKITLIEGSIVLKTTTQKRVNLSHITGYWYRRGQLRFLVNSFDYRKSNLSNQIIDGVKAFKNGEVNKLIDYLYLYLDRIPKSITSFFNVSPNKLHVLDMAKQCGLLIPKTMISTQKEDSIAFLLSCNSKCITKPINEIFFSNENNMSYRSFTAPVSADDLKDMADNSFFPMLMQETIDKKVEIRIFYLQGLCYSMGIFSQSDPTTAVDFRNYNNEQPNRCVPFKLPDNVLCKIVQLMNLLNYKTGSIDMLLDSAGNYYFLEINPIGQFGMVSIPCNYNIEKKIANSLF